MTTWKLQQTTHYDFPQQYLFINLNAQLQADPLALCIAGTE